MRTFDFEKLKIGSVFVDDYCVCRNNNCFLRKFLKRCRRDFQEICDDISQYGKCKNIINHVGKLPRKKVLYVFLIALITSSNDMISKCAMVLRHL